MSHLTIGCIRTDAILLALGITLGDAAGAAATSSTSPTSLSGIKATATTDICDRVNDLNAAIAKVRASTGLDANEAGLARYLGTDISPLQQLNTTIQGDATVRQAAHDFGTIFRDYRVDVIVLPAAHIAADAGRATTTVIPHLTVNAAKAQSPENQSHTATPDRRPQWPDHQRDECHGRSGRHGARLHTSTVECRPRPAGRLENIGSAAERALAKGRADVTQIAQDIGAGCATTTTATAG